MPTDPPGFEDFRKKVHDAKTARQFDEIIAQIVGRREGIDPAAITDEVRREVNPRLVMAFWDNRAIRP